MLRQTAATAAERLMDALTGDNIATVGITPRGTRMFTRARTTTARERVARGIAVACGAIALSLVPRLVTLLTDPAFSGPVALLVGISILVTLAAAAALWSLLGRGPTPVDPAVLENLLRLEEQVSAHMAGRLHDTAAQSLVVATLLARSGTLDPDALTEQILAAEREMRDVIGDARPPNLVSNGLGAACQYLHEMIDLRDGLLVTWEWSGGNDERIPEIVAALAYRFFQECLGNTARHSGASSARAHLHLGPSELNLSVWDAGCGFTPPDLTNGPDRGAASGLPLLAARGAVLGAAITVTSGPDQGTTVSLRAPLSHRSAQTMVRLGTAPRDSSHVFRGGEPLMAGVLRTASGDAVASLPHDRQAVNPLGFRRQRRGWRSASPAVHGPDRRK